MFNWICPQCGKEVPPSRTECPNCAQQGAPAGYPGTLPVSQPASPTQTWQQPPQPPPQAYPPQAPPAWQPPAPPPPPPPPPPVYQQAPPPQAWPPQQYAPPAPTAWPPQAPPQGGAQPWPPPVAKKQPSPLVAGAGVAVALILVFSGIYYFMSRGDSPSGKSAAPATAAAAAGKAGSSPIQRSIEITGLRFVTEKGSPAVKFVVVNHSSAPLSDVVGSVTLLAGTSKSDEDSIGTFNLNVDVIEANGSKEMSAPLKTKLKPYELPDWQNATADVQITSPEAQ